VATSRAAELVASDRHHVHGMPTCVPGVAVGRFVTLAVRTGQGQWAAAASRGTLGRPVPAE
jgi:hypothetical protein